MRRCARVLVLSVRLLQLAAQPGPRRRRRRRPRGLRVAFFVVPGVLLAARVDPFVLGDHLGQRLRLPARPVVAAVAALQRFESLDQQWHQLRRTRRVRGLDVGRSPLARARQVGALTAGLLVQSLRQAGRMAVAMEARGFSAPREEGRRRTWAEPAPWRRTDSLMVRWGWPWPPYRPCCGSAR